MHRASVCMGTRGTRHRTVSRFIRRGQAAREGWTQCRSGPSGCASPDAARSAPSPCPQPGRRRRCSSARVRSGVSRGTETLVFRGAVPPDQHERMRAPHQDGDFPGPVKYGYLSVGVVEAGAAGAARPHRVLPAPAPDGVRRPGRGRDRGARRTCPRTGRCSRGPSRPRSTRSGTPRPWSATGSPWSARGWSAAAWPGCWPRSPGSRSPWSTSTRPAPRWPRRWASRSLIPPRRRAAATWSCTRARPRPGCSARWSCWRRTARWSTSAGTATPRSGSTSAAPSTPAGCGCAPARSARWPCPAGTGGPGASGSRWPSSCSATRPTTRCSPAPRRSRSCRS